MKYVLSAILVALLAQAANAQIIIDGRKALYDSRTNTMLATIPKSAFGSNLRVSVTLEEGWSDLKIDGSTPKNGIYTFKSIEGGKTYPVTMTNKDEYVVTSNLTFTFLPIMQLNGQFGYDYQEGTATLIDTEEGERDHLTATLKWRGGTTNTADKHKRNYKIKFSEDQQFFGLRKDNVWILDAGQADLFRVRNRIATELWNDMARKPYYADQEPEARSGVRGRMVELFLNKTYQGIYCLTEHMDRKEMKLKKLDPETGEIRGGLWKAVGYGASLMSEYQSTYNNKSETWDYFEMKYPRLDDVEETDWSTLYEAIRFVAESSDSQFREQVADYFDIPVVIDYYIFIQALNALDNWGKNMYWAVYDKTLDKKMTLAVWDLDATVGQQWVEKFRPGAAGPWSPEHVKTSNLNLITRLIKLNVDEFNEQVTTRYHYLRQNVLSTDNLIQRYANYFDNISLSGAAAREENLWSGDSDIDGEELNFETEIYYISYWISRHLKYLDDNLFKAPEEMPTSIDNAIDDMETSLPVYNLNGQRMNASPVLHKGIYIRNGYKFIVK